MAVKNVPCGAKCSCGRKARPGQRTCKVCHAAKMKAYRKNEAKNTVYGYVDLRSFLDFKQDFIKGLAVVKTPGSRQTLVRITICKNRKKQ